MVLFNQEGIIQKYNSPEEILQEFFNLRMEFYVKRRQFLIQVLFSGYTAMNAGCMTSNANSIHQELEIDARHCSK